MPSGSPSIPVIRSAESALKPRRPSPPLEAPSPEAPENLGPIAFDPIITSSTNADNSISDAQVRYSDGVVSLDTTDLQSFGFGTPWGQSRSWSNGPGYAYQTNNGDGMVDLNLPYLIPVSDDYTIAVVTSGTNALYFDGGHERFDGKETLTEDSDTGDFILTDTAGDTLDFYGFGSSLPAAEQGQLKTFTDAAGNVTDLSNRTSDGEVAEVTRTSTTGSITVTESFLYDYIASGVNQGLISSVTLRRQTNGGSWSTVRQVQYDYYDGTDSNGNVGDLETAKIEDANGNLIDEDYYRYYTPDETNGYTHGLKYFFSATSSARLAANVPDPFTAPDSEVAPYADDYFQYDAQHRVTEATVQGTGPSNSGGLGTFTYSYTTSDNPDGYDSWAVKTVETLPDGNQNIVFTNYVGQVMLTVFVDNSDPADPALEGKQWITFNEYLYQGQIIETAQPSAVLGYDESSPDLLDFRGGSSQYLANSSGVIDIYYYYYFSTTATDTAAGGVGNYLGEEAVQNGQLGTPVLLDSTQYFAHPNAAGSSKVYPVATYTVYRNDDGSGAEVTSYAYTWFSGTTQIQSMTVTAPSISADQNGPDSPDVTTTIYNAYGQAIWSRDGGGFIDYTAYDIATGAVIETITDVDTSTIAAPDDWMTPTGGGLNLVDEQQVDALGRTIEETDPNGNVTYTIYDDSDHEVRTYLGWNSASEMPTGPTEVTRDDQANGYVETLTMSAAPSLTDGVPDGTEPISDIQSLERDYTDNSGDLIESDQYFSFINLTYATTPHLGTVGTNYYATTNAYDDRGRLARAVDAVGTITDTVYDSLGRPVSTYVGTKDSTTDGACTPAATPARPRTWSSSPRTSTTTTASATAT